MGRVKVALIVVAVGLVLGGCSREAKVVVTNLGMLDVNACVDGDCDVVVGGGEVQVEFVVEWRGWFSDVKEVEFKAEVVGDTSRRMDRRYELQDGELVYWQVGWDE